MTQTQHPFRTKWITSKQRIFLELLQLYSNPTKQFFLLNFPFKKNQSLPDFNPIQTGGGGGETFDATQDLIHPLLFTNDSCFHFNFECLFHLNFDKTDNKSYLMKLRYTTNLMRKSKF